jgi:hypothetical protein
MTTQDTIWISLLATSLFAATVAILTMLAVPGWLSSRVLVIWPWSLAAIYAVWCLYVLFFGGDWAPIYLLYPLWPFGILLALLTKSIPNSLPEGIQRCLDIGIWLVGGMMWLWVLGYLASKSAVGIAKLCHKRVHHD